MAQQSLRGAQTQTAEPSVSHAVVTAVADLIDEDPNSLDPLFKTIDPDALERLFSSAHASGGSAERIEFTYSGCDVVVSADGTVQASRDGRETATDWATQ